MQERRTNKRVKGKNSVAVKILASKDAPGLVGKTFFCSTDDISSEGLRFCVHTLVPVGSMLELRVAFSIPPRAFTHIGRVVWEKEVDGSNPFAIGVKFTETARAEMLNWKDLVSVRIQQAEELGEGLAP